MPRYVVSVKRWGDYYVDADTAEEAKALAESMARHHSPDSDTYLTEADTAAEVTDE